MVGIELLRDPLQPVFGMAPDLPRRSERIRVSRLTPPGGVVVDHLANGTGHLGLRAPKTGPGEVLARLDVEIEARGVDVFSLIVSEMDTNVCLVWLSLGESHVPV